MSPDRRLPVGAEVLEGGAHFRVWAPRHNDVAVVLESGSAAGEHGLNSEPDGYFSAHIAGVAAGDRYRFRLGAAGTFPDPCLLYTSPSPRD